MTHTLLDKHMLILLMTADTRLSQTELRVGIVLLEYYNQQTGAAWPSHNTMAGDIGVHRTTAIRAVNGLIEKGYFKLLERGGFHKSSRYRPRFEAVAQPLLGSSSDAPWWLQQRTEVVAPALHESSYQPGFKTGVDNEGDPPAGAAPRGAPAKEEFGRFWIAYPKKQHRQDAEVAFNSIIESGAATVEDLVAGAVAYATAVKGKTERFVAAPANWLRKKRWTDEPYTGGTEKGSLYGASHCGLTDDEMETVMECGG